MTPREGRPWLGRRAAGPGPAFSIFTSLPFLRSCGGAGKRRGFASGARVIGCPGSLARAVWCIPGGEGRSGHCSNHRRHRLSRSRRSLGRRASISERRLPGCPDADKAPRSARFARSHAGQPRVTSAPGPPPSRSRPPSLARAQLSRHATPSVFADPSQPCPGRLRSGPLDHCCCLPCCCCCCRCPATRRGSGSTRTPPRTTRRWRRARSSS